MLKTLWGVPFRSRAGPQNAEQLISNELLDLGPPRVNENRVGFLAILHDRDNTDDRHLEQIPERGNPASRARKPDACADRVDPRQNVTHPRAESGARPLWPRVVMRAMNLDARLAASF